MNSATIRRGTGSAKRATSSRPGQRRALRRQTRIDRLIALLPVSRDTLARLLSLCVAVLALILLWMIAQFFGLPAMAGQEAAQMTRRAGFQVAKVEVLGVNRMDEMPVYNLALNEVDRSMLTVDLTGLRDRILQLGWVADARISRRLPDTLVVDIVERVPAAVWQHGGKLSLIDGNGIVLESVDGRSMPDLPLIVGPDANRKTRALQQVMEAAPALKPLLAGATWVGNRRWDLRFQSGETLALPEGDRAAAAALMKFAQLEGVNHLLGRGIVRFDMRDPSRFVLRMPEDRRTAQDGKAASDDGSTAAAPATDKAGDGDSGDGAAKTGKQTIEGRRTVRAGEA